MTFEDIFNTAFVNVQLGFVNYAKEYEDDIDNIKGSYILSAEFFVDIDKAIKSKQNAWRIIEHYIDDPSDILVGYSTDYEGNNAPLDLFVDDVRNKLLDWIEENKEEIMKMIVDQKWKRG